MNYEETFLFTYRLGSLHDGRENRCGEAEGFLMSAQAKDLPVQSHHNIYRFSECSIGEMRMFLGYLKR